MYEKIDTKKTTLLQKLKELVAEAEDDEKILSELIPKEHSDNSDKSREHTITKSTVVPVLIC